jgi:hypothetical protein
MTNKNDLPKKKPNYYCIYDKTEKKFKEIKYLSQQELAEGWEQIIPQCNNKKLINHFSVTLAFLPEKFWYKLKRVVIKGEENYKIIKDGLTYYTIIETNQDDTMKKLFIELKNPCPNKSCIEEYINELDPSQHVSWLVLRAKHFLNNNILYYPNYIENFEEIDITRFL